MIMCQALFRKQMERITESGGGGEEEVTVVVSRWRTEAGKGTGLLGWHQQGSLEQVTRAGRAVLLHPAEHRWPSGLFLAQFHLHFIGFLLLVYFPRDKVIYSKNLII